MTIRNRLLARYYEGFNQRYQLINDTDDLTDTELIEKIKSFPQPDITDPWWHEKVIADLPNYAFYRNGGYLRDFWSEVTEIANENRPALKQIDKALYNFCREYYRFKD